MKYRVRNNIVFHSKYKNKSLTQRYKKYYTLTLILFKVKIIIIKIKYIIIIITIILIESIMMIIIITIIIMKIIIIANNNNYNNNNSNNNINTHNYSSRSAWTMGFALGRLSGPINNNSCLRILLFQLTKLTLALACGVPIWSASILQRTGTSARAIHTALICAIPIYRLYKI